jgi:hypothetical protein
MTYDRTNRLHAGMKVAPCPCLGNKPAVEAITWRDVEEFLFETTIQALLPSVAPTGQSHSQFWKPTGENARTLSAKSKNLKQTLQADRKNRIALLGERSPSHLLCRPLCHDDRAS